MNSGILQDLVSADYYSCIVSHVCGTCYSAMIGSERHLNGPPTGTC
jgi:hypothetical protein